jgi:hypothetical protein
MRSKFVSAIRLTSTLLFGSVIVGPLQGAGYTPLDIGGATNGATTAVAGGYDVSSRSGEIGGTSDKFHFAHEERSGDFDVQVRVDGVTITDAFVEAGLMARESLAANARYAAVFSSSAQLGCYFESRATAATAAVSVSPPTGFPVNYPQTYLRLKRTGNVFTGFGSFDGNSWQQLGATTSAIPGTVFFGLALASHNNTNAVATARFRDITAVSNPRTVASKPAAEPLGPSNRRTGIVFSEIMYNPGPFEGTNNLEFIEIYNGESIFVDLGGWQITGGVNYTFAEGFKLQAGEFAVVAADPAALERVYGYRRALGPFIGRLNNGGDTLRLLNRLGALRVEVSYESDAPWPAAADGGGHSLVLARPSYGEDDPRAWAPSEKMRGTPGEVNAVWPHPWSGAVINEFLAHTDDPVLDFVELYNASTNDLDLSNCILTDQVGTNRFRIPQGTVLLPREYISFNQNALGFSLSSAGETIYLLSPTADRVLDAIRFGGQENGVSSGRSPDGSPTIRRLASPTPGAGNASWRIEDVIINEVMYHPITGDDADQYIEIHNRSSDAVDLTGWRFEDGIDFQFPAGARLPGGGYAVVGRDIIRLLANYPNLTTNNAFGNFDGDLSNSGERLALSKRDFVTETNQFGIVVTNAIHITVSELTYFDGGRWSELADGGGSSLELIDPRADTLRAASWAASDETAKAPWTTVQVTDTLTLGNGSYTANRFQIIMQGAGECLIDDIELIPAGSTNILINGDFETPTNTWRFFGNHSRSAIEPLDGQNVLHVRAPGDGDTAHNAIRGNMVRALSSGTATVRAKIRWLSGWPEVILRIRGNSLEVPARMQVPKNLGTPGQANSRRVNNSGPAIFDVTHTPALPRVNEAVVVSCRVSDPDGVAQPQLIYRVDPALTLTNVVMLDNGTAGDALAGDGIFSGTIPGRPAGNLVAFRIAASDRGATVATNLFPADAPIRECHIRWEDLIPWGTLAHYHMWNTAATEGDRNRTPDADNTFRDATLVYGNFRVIYNIGFRDKGSPYHQGGGDFAVTVPRDELLLGIDDRVFGSTGNGGSESTGMKTDVSGWVGYELGIPFLHSHYMRLYRNGARFRDIVMDMEQPNRYYAQSWFGGTDLKDDLFKIALWFEFDDSNSGFTPTGASLARFPSTGPLRLARYRWNWQIRPSTETANDYSTVFNLVNAVSTPTERIRTLPLLADVEEWMRMFAFNRIIGNWDSLTYNVQQNMFLYAPLGQRAELLPWDLDFVLGEGDGATTALFNAASDTALHTLFTTPAYRRMLWRAYQDAANGPLVTQNFQPQLDARRAVFVKNAVTGLGTPTSITSYMNGRRSYILGQLRSFDAQDFSVTSNGGADFTSTDSSVAITGTAPFAVATIEVNGVPFPVNWTGNTNWQLLVPLGAPTNFLQIVGRDLRGNVVTGAVDTVTVKYEGVVPQAQDWVVFNEVMYNPAEPDAEFIELYNRHPNFAFDLSGYRLRGVDFVFPAGTFIQPNGYLVIAEDRAAFAAVYGPQLPVLGPFAGQLQNDGERLRLVRPGAVEAQDILIDDIRYSGSAPWPLIANGNGPSLQLIDPAQDNWRVGNWAATAVNDVNRATPGRTNAVRATIEPFASLWLNEVQPVNIAGPQDNNGEREPWIELYNPGGTAIELSGMYLSDDPLQLGKWQFPSGTRVGAGQFLMVWADGEQGETTATSLHTSFRITSTNGLVILSRTQGSSAAAMDFLDFSVTSTAYSYGSYPDGEPRRRRMLYVATPGAPNNSSIPDVQVFINEWMGAAQSTLPDPADGQFEDWFELYNAGTNTVDLSGFYLTDTLNDPTQFQIPAGFQIAPGSYRLIWADGEAGQNAAGRDLHVSFSLGASGDAIALFTPDEVVVNSIEFGEQTANVSEGRFPDGSDEPFVFFVTATPGRANQAQFANRSPVIANIAEPSVNEGQLLSFNVTASDPDAGQTVRFSLSDAPQGALIDSQTGLFSWTPSEAHGPGIHNVTVRATDNGTPARGASRTFAITVREVNQAPSIAPIQNVTIPEGLPFTSEIAAADSDFPGQNLRFSIEGGPAGLEIDASSGDLAWTPAEEQGPGTYTISVRVTDDGQPALFTTLPFNITVQEINNAPIIEPIQLRAVQEGTAITTQISARDPETPPAKLTYIIETAPDGATINADTGLLTWTPSEAQGPRDYNFVIRVSEPGGEPSTTVSFAISVSEVNTAPTLEPIANIVVRRGDQITITNRVSDSDLPAQALTFEVVGALPPGAALNPLDGVISWTVPANLPALTNRITIKVTDDGKPTLSAEHSFNVIVRDSSQPDAPDLTVTHTAAGEIRISWFGASGQLYRVEAVDQLVSPQWQAVSQLNGSGSALVYSEVIPSNTRTRFFRVVAP